ncbi:MAG TPA: ABC transporter ATP-binding protein [Candidatus Saccharimonadales bacterium]|nr:ABC transporter ATP-binding protein [Candidatus Saccharimonadales bacterium]
MTSKTSPALKLSRLTKRYDSKHGIYDINLEVARGEVFGFLGPNGAGKSTTINTILDLLKPQEGTISVLGLDHHADMKKVHARLGYLSGDMETDPSLTGKQYLSYVANLRGGVDESIIDDLAYRLKSDLSAKIRHLSRGNRQKIGLIAALMHDPDILILDEPTSGLDPLIQAEFNAIIREHKERGKTTFISSHVLSEVQSICDRVGFIKEGKLVHVSTLKELMKSSLRNVTVHFATKVPREKIAKLKGVSNLRHEDGMLAFAFGGNMNELLQALAAHPIDNLQIAEPDLEDLFMNYYRSEERDV